MMSITKTNKLLFLLLIINVSISVLHMRQNYENVFYFFQLTIIAHHLVIANFLFSMMLHERKSSHKIKNLLSRFHLMSLSLEAIVVIGFWGLRIFFEKGIIGEGERSLYAEILSISVHGISFLTMFYFIKTDQIVMENERKIKYLIHLCWGIPFLFLQYLHWILTGEHVYPFLKEFTWIQLAVFELSLYFISVTIDYTLALRHGLKLTIKAIGNKDVLIELQKKHQDEDAERYASEKLEKSKAQKKMK